MRPNGAIPMLVVTRRRRPSAVTVACSRTVAHERRGDVLGLACVGVGQQYRELVAAEPRERVARAQPILQERRDRQDELVTGMVAERVVDVLEVVEVEDEQRPARSVARDVRDVGVELLLEAAAVEQARQRIVVGEPAQLVLEAAALGDVLDLVEQVQRLGRRRRARG